MIKQKLEKIHAPQSPKEDRERKEAEKHQKRNAARRARYQRDPQIKEKKRIEMAAKKAAIRARRRQWDPPTKKQLFNSLKDRKALSEAVRSNHDSLILGPAPSSKTSLRGAAVCSANSAEIIASMALTQMAAAHLAGEEQRNIGLPRNPWNSKGLRPPTGAAGPLPQRSTGPLTAVQQAQIAVAKLNSGPLLGPTPAEANRWADLNDRDLPPELKTMGREHWLEIFRWERGVGRAVQDQDWDAEIVAGSLSGLSSADEII
ncbi:hypothetical protein B0H15DRAFT_804884 [Mycena belliarum]|uniref:Uncharacterized protein n=1 Tax=Mycena belliarum TaxID=1033014 RepID=A0AAD6TU18_9AGAR|nr:hypothetical protein B0H15DRAFT_804884 [Mycena belliae]